MKIKVFVTGITREKPQPIFLLNELREKVDADPDWPNILKEQLLEDLTKAQADNEPFILMSETTNTTSVISTNAFSTFTIQVKEIKERVEKPSEQDSDQKWTWKKHMKSY